MEYKLRTSFLFRLLLKAAKPDAIFDVGSMDASESLWFRKVLPGARIVLFEANPSNYRTIADNPTVQKAAIQLENRVVWNRGGTKTFFIEHPSHEPGVDEHIQGMSSTRPRIDRGSPYGTSAITAEAVRIDAFVDSMQPYPHIIALWIDVEGAAFEVLEGIAAVKDRIGIIHVEVETVAAWSGQHLKPDIIKLLEAFGFILLARGRIEEQHDLVFINRNLFDKAPRKFKLIVWLAYLLTIKIPSPF